MGVTWVGKRLDGNFVPPGDEPWDDQVGIPNRLLVPQWPRTSTPRTNPLFRTLSDPLVRPLASRIFGSLRYRNFSGPNPNLSPAWIEYFWGDWQPVGENHLSLSSGPSPHASSFSMDLEYLEVVPETGRSGTRIKFEYRPEGANTLTRTSVWDSFQYNIGYEFSPDFSDPPVDYSNYPIPHTQCAVNFHGMAHCYPVDTFAPKEDFKMNELAGVLLRCAVPQSISGGRDLDFQSPDREFGGQWWNPLGNANEIIVPTPWNYVMLACQVTADSSRVNEMLAGFRINGSLDSPYRMLTRAPTSNGNSLKEVQAVSPFWIPVTPGDVIQLYASGTSTSINTTPERNWLSVKAAYLI